MPNETCFLNVQVKFNLFCSSPVHQESTNFSSDQAFVLSKFWKKKEVEITTFLFTEKTMAEAVVFHDIIDQKPFSSMYTTSSESNKVFMLDIGQCSYLRYELPFPTQ